MKIIFVNALFALLLIAGQAHAAADTPPEQLVKSTTEEVVAIIKKDKAIQAGDRSKITALVDEKVLPHFDFTRMTQLAMGRYWRQASPEQQQALVKEFRQLLVRTYAISLANYRDQQVDYKPVKKDSDAEVTVKTEFSKPGAQPIAIDYSMHKAAEGWKVFDVVVEGVSLVTNYRGSFNELVRKDGIDGLIKMLTDKNRAADKG
jgi:phospholipid transport system substrate-binding protein